jgi:hypothetical protein
MTQLSASPADSGQPYAFLHPQLFVSVCGIQPHQKNPKEIFRFFLPNADFRYLCHPENKGEFFKTSSLSVNGSPGGFLKAFRSGSQSLDKRNMPL